MKITSAILSAIFIGAAITYSYKKLHALQFTIITLHSFDEVKIPCDSTTLVTFDVDDTIITAQDPTGLDYDMPILFQLYAFWTYPSIVCNHELVKSHVLKKSPRKLTENSVAHVIKQCKKKCTVIGLTCIETGSYGIISNVPAWRSAMLKSMGIHFSKQNNYIFNDLPPYRNSYPILYENILYTNYCPKHKLLQAYLTLDGKKPTHIISFDDNKKILQDIAHMCKKQNIAFTGYHYIGAKLPKKQFKYVHAYEQLTAWMKQ